MWEKASPTIDETKWLALSECNMSRGFAPLIILIIITLIAGGAVVVIKTTSLPLGQSLGLPLNKAPLQTTPAPKDILPTATAVPKIADSSQTPSPATKVVPVPTTGTLEALLSGPEDAVPPTLRLFDDQLRMVVEDDVSKQGPYSRSVGGYKYVIKDLAPGKYLAGAAGNFYFSPQNVTIQAGKTTSVTLKLNPSSTKITTTLTGRTFVDSNGNKKYDSGELNVEGVVDVNIYLLTKDGEKRVYGFSGLPGGPYDLGGTSQHFLGKYVFKSGTQPGYTPVNLEVEMGLYNTSNNVDIPFTTQSTFSNPGSVTGHVFVDTNGNGQYDGGELKPNNYFPSVGLEKPNSQFRYDTVTVNDQGGFSFSNLSPGNYVLKVDPVPNYSPKQGNVSFTLGSGENKTIDFIMTQQ